MTKNVGITIQFCKVIDKFLKPLYNHSLLSFDGEFECNTVCKHFAEKFSIFKEINSKSLAEYIAREFMKGMDKYKFIKGTDIDQFVIKQKGLVKNVGSFLLYDTNLRNEFEDEDRVKISCYYYGMG